MRLTALICVGLFHIGVRSVRMSTTPTENDPLHQFQLVRIHGKTRASARY
jgi:hypothetical protein